MDKFYKPGDKIHNYTIIKVIGQGRYGIVYLIEDQNHTKYILKQLKVEMLEKTKSKLFYEKELLSKLNNSKFPKFIDNFVDDDIQGFVLEYVEGKVFEDLLYNGYEFNRQEIYTIAEQLLDIIELLHKSNIVHRDIRVPNVIIKDTKELVLIDFGLARYLDNKKHKKDIDYWFLSDFLIHLYYTTFNPDDTKTEENSAPWFEELELNDLERQFLKKLMGLESNYNNIDEIRLDLDKIKNLNQT